MGSMVFEDSRGYATMEHADPNSMRAPLKAGATPALSCPILSMRHRMKRNAKTTRQPASKSSAWIDAKMQAKSLALEMEDVIGQRRIVEALRQPSIR
jgi:hypothetical protein